MKKRARRRMERRRRRKGGGGSSGSSFGICLLLHPTSCRMSSDKHHAEAALRGMCMPAYAARQTREIIATRLTPQMRARQQRFEKIEAAWLQMRGYTSDAVPPRTDLAAAQAPATRADPARRRAQVELNEEDGGRPPMPSRHCPGSDSARIAPPLASCAEDTAWTPRSQQARLGSSADSALCCAACLARTAEAEAAEPSAEADRFVWV